MKISKKKAKKTKTKENKKNISRTKARRKKPITYLESAYEN